MTENPYHTGPPDPYPGGPPGPYPFGPYPGGPYQGGPYQGGYPPPPMPYGNHYPATPKNGLGVAALVIAIIALMGSFTVIGGVLLGIVAVVLGFIARGRVRSGEANNGGVALAGLILGVISIIAGLAFIAIWVGLFKQIGAADYLDCMQQAGQNRRAAQQCSEEFRQSMSENFPNNPTPTR